ncbi:MAG: hypothetical protein ACOCXQ_05065 [Patescibacteria group bacterium]
MTVNSGNRCFNLKNKYGTIDPLMKAIARLIGELQEESSVSQSDVRKLMRRLEKNEEQLKERMGI